MWPWSCFVIKERNIRDYLSAMLGMFLQLHLTCFFSTKTILQNISPTLFFFWKQDSTKVNLQVTKTHIITILYSWSFTLECFCLSTSIWCRSQKKALIKFFIENVFFLAFFLKSLSPHSNTILKADKTWPFVIPVLIGLFIIQSLCVEKHPCGNMQACEIYSLSLYTLSDPMSPFHNRRLYVCISLKKCTHSCFKKHRFFFSFSWKTQHGFGQIY